jgi:hypothetical protein
MKKTLVIILAFALMLTMNACFGRNKGQEETLPPVAEATTAQLPEQTLPLETLAPTEAVTEPTEPTEATEEPEEPEKPENDRTPEKDTDPGKNTAPDRKNDSSGTNGSSVRPGNNQGNRDTGKPVSSNETEEDEDQITAEKITEDDKADENVNNGETGKDNGETVPEDNEQKEEDKTGEPEAQDPSAITTGTAESTGSGTSWLWTLPVLGVAVPLFIWFIIGKRRKDEEEQ